jgi:outer membrane protein OmpA-like peptidoglycan-associated protein
MKKIILITCIIIAYMPIYSQQVKPEFRFIADFWSLPIYHDSVYFIDGISFNGSFMGGVRFSKFTIGAELIEQFNYFIAGKWNIVRGTIDLYFEPVNWVELKWGIGGSWCGLINDQVTYSSYILDSYNKSRGGMAFLFDVNFRPWRYIDLVVLNKLDLYFSEADASGVIPYDYSPVRYSFNPYYYGSIRCNFHPYIQWLNLYVELGGMTQVYNTRNIQSGMFVWGIGISIDMTPARDIKINPKKNDEERTDEKENLEKEKQDKILAEKEKSDKNRMEQERLEKERIENEKLIETEKNIIELNKAKEGEIVEFSSIIFYADSDKIKEESFNILDKIAEVLINRSDIKIEIIGHTNDVGNLKAEVDLSKKRAESVKKYLMTKGIDPSRMRTIGLGSLYTKMLSMDEANRRVEIKISKD